MSTVDDILEERGNTHGSYSDIVNIRANMLKELIRMYTKRHVGVEIDMKLVIMWNDVLLKLVRSAANPEHQDNWDDLAGYANIIQEVMEAENAIGSK